MCDHPSPSHLIHPFRLKQSQHGVECSPHLERPSPLEILAFEKEVYLGICRPLAFKLGTHQCLGILRCRRDAVKRLEREYWCPTNMWLDEEVGSEDALLGQG